MAGIPKLSHLQFLVTGLLRQDALSGRALRERLEGFGVKKSGPAFYQLMSRLEDSGLVEGSYHQEIIESQIIRERHYRLTAPGLRSWEASRDFYMGAIESFGGLEGMARA